MQARNRLTVEPTVNEVHFAICWLLSRREHNRQKFDLALDDPSLAKQNLRRRPALDIDSALDCGWGR